MGKELRWTISQLEKEMNTVEGNLGIPLMGEAGGDVQRFLDLLKDELKHLPLTNDVQCKNDEDSDAFYELRDKYNDICNERKQELLEQIAEADLKGHKTAVIDLIREYSGDAHWEIRDMVEDILSNMPAQDAFASIIDLVYSDSREDIKQGLTILKDLNVYSGEDNLMSQLVRRMKEIFDQSGDPEDYLIHLIYHSFAKHQNAYPGVYREAGDLYVRSLDLGYFAEDIVEDALYMISTMSFDLIQKMDEAIIEDISRALYKLVKAYTEGNSQWVQDHVIGPLKEFKRYSAAAQKALDWFDKKKKD